MPIRFESPSVGGRGDSYLDPKGWQLGIAYRRLTADEYFVRGQRNDAAGPGGQPLDFDIHSFALSANYAITERFGLSLDVPWSTGTTSRFYGDGKRHATSAAGIGDIRLTGTVWVWDPLDIPRGNVALGLGAKAPTGSHTSMDSTWAPSGVSSLAPVDQAIQLGDGGWGMILRAEGFRRIYGRSFVYAAGEYLATLKEKTDVPSPRSSALTPQMMGVPDVYSVRAGATTVIAPRQGMTISLGLRHDATTKGDLFGGKDMSFRRPAIVGYVDPGVSLTKGANTFYLNTPVRAYQDFRLDYSYKPGDRAAGGDLARYLLFMGYTRRF